MQTMRRTIYDMGTNDFLIGIMEKHEKMVWMLRAHLNHKLTFIFLTEETFLINRFLKFIDKMKKE